MAKVFSPSGETEFFQITELQKAFEKELKTGEKVSIVPGAKEASFLREAPIRADLTGLFEEFKDRVLNPVAPPQPPAFRYNCDALDPASFLTVPVVGCDSADAPSDAMGNPTVLGAYTMKFTSTINPYTTSPTMSVPNVPYIIPVYPNTPPYPDCTGWLVNDANPPIFGSLTKTAFQLPAFPNFWFGEPFGYRGLPQVTPNVTAYTISDWLNLEYFVENWLPTGGPSSTAGLVFGRLYPYNAVTVQWIIVPGFGYQQYTVPTFTANVPHTPAGAWRKVFELKADLKKSASSLTSMGGCWFQLDNFRFTNLYP